MSEQEAVEGGLHGPPSDGPMPIPPLPDRDTRAAGPPGKLGPPGPLDPEYRRQFSKTFTFRELAAGRHMSCSATEVNDDCISLVELQRSIEFLNKAEMLTPEETNKCLERLEAKRQQLFPKPQK